jgi:hypothetical protein
MIRIDLNQGYLNYVFGHLTPFWTIEQLQKNDIEFVEKFKEIFINIEHYDFKIEKLSAVEIVPAKSENIHDVTILVMLQDWKPGHYIEIDKEGIINWNAGDYYIFRSDLPYAESNIGDSLDIKYTLKMHVKLKPLNSLYHQNNKLYEYNIHDRPWIIDNHLIKRLKESIHHNYGNPCMIYLGNENIHQLESLIYSQASLNDINEKGLDIYLYEPMCAYQVNQEIYQEGGTKHTEWFYSEFNKVNYDNLRSDELDSILKFVANNKAIDVRVHVNEYDVEKYFPYYKDKLKLITDDICLKGGWFKKIIDPNYLDYKHTIKFLSLNYRYTFHRNLVVSFLCNLDSKISWNFKCEYEHMSYGPYFNLNKPIWDRYRDSIKKGVDTINEKSPFLLDFTFTESSQIEHNYFKNPFPQHRVIHKIDLFAIEEHYKNIFCEIICETRFAQPMATYSEKIHQAISYYKPFIVVGPPHTLKYLKSQGFQTFNEFWDESYDNIENHEKRLVKIFDLITEIDSMTITQCNELYERMMPILSYNQKLLKTKIRP